MENNQGSFLPTTFIWDVEQINEINVNSQEFKELLIRLYQNLSLMATILNTKDSAFYPLEEFCNGQVFFPATGGSLNDYNQRQVFRTVVNFGALPNTTSKSIPHNIDMFNGFSCTRIYGAASNQNSMQYIPLPYASPTANKNIEIAIDKTNVTLTTAMNYSAYTTTYIVLEYVKE